MYNINGHISITSDCGMHTFKLMNSCQKVPLRLWNYHHPAFLFLRSLYCTYPNFSFFLMIKKLNKVPCWVKKKVVFIPNVTQTVMTHLCECLLAVPLTVDAGRLVACGPCHFSGETGTLHRLRSLLYLVLVAAPVSCDHFACPAFCRETTF